MKYTLRSFAILFALSAMIACTRNPDDTLSSNNTNNGGSGSGAVTVAGSWRVTLFSERGTDETTDFAGYAFTFDANGVLTASKNGANKTGTWSVNSSNTRFNIDLGAKTDANRPLGELTDNWQVISITSTEIKLTDDNASSAEFLTFTKN